MFYVEVLRDGRWCLVGQYETEEQAWLIADDYYAHGEQSRVVSD